MKIYLLSFLIIGYYSVVKTQSTPYPEGYLNDLTRVDMSNAPMYHTCKGGKKVKTIIKGGRKWNHAWYWDQVRLRAPQMFDIDNNALIDEGLSPEVNDRFIKHNPQFVKFKGEIIHHHHYQQGNIAYALPKELHVGKKFTKLWHKFGKRSLILVGAALAIYEVGKTGNPFSESPFDLWMLEEAEELELSAIEASISMGYHTLKSYIENCKSCSDLAVYYADYTEVIYYLYEGQAPKPIGNSTFSELLPRFRQEASYLLNKVVEFGIVMRDIGQGYEAVGIIEIPSYE
ncbi:MAG: hypothetical protein J5I98_32935 [Phaeodactylibacter sp.]|nr:hypothetical protein [Phaeodactylibacter sp.]